jgi:hypothetical protein
VHRPLHISTRSPPASEDEIVLLEDEIAALKLSLFSAQTQLEEQGIASSQTITTLRRESSLAQQETALRREHDSQKIADLLKQNERLRMLSRENTRELLNVKKDFSGRERGLIEEKQSLICRGEEMHKTVLVNKDRVLNAERVRTSELKR